MIVLKQYEHPDVVDFEELERFKVKVREQKFEQIPQEVLQFVEAINNKLGDFAQFGRERMPISGKELLLCGITEWFGEQVDKFSLYFITVPKMMAVDYRTTMIRLYRRKGKQGLIDFCKVKVKDTDLEQVLDILNVHVFHEERPEFKRILQEIESAKKLEPSFA